MIIGHYYKYKVASGEYILLYRGTSNVHYAFTILKSPNKNRKKGERGTIEITEEDDLIEIEEKQAILEIL